MNYKNRYGLTIEEQNTNHLSLQNITSKKDFLNTQKVTDIDIRIEPIPLTKNDDDEQINLPICQINFPLAAIQYLLHEDEKMIDVDEVLLESKEKEDSFYQFIFQLLGFVRLEYTDIGILYSVAGAFQNPIYTSLAWPEKINCDCDGLNQMDDMDD